MYHIIREPLLSPAPDYFITLIVLTALLNGCKSRVPSALLLLLCAYCGSLTAGAQEVPVRLPFRKYTSANGLIHNRCHVIRQDGSGYIWIGTDVGMVRYDGRSFRLCSVPGERFVSSRTAIVSGGDVCFGIDNRGIAICREDSVRFLPFPAGRFGGINGLLRLGTDSFLFTDGSRFIWRYTRERIQASAIAMNDSGNRGFLELCRDGEGNLWAGSDYGLCHFPKGDLRRPVWIRASRGNYINCIRNGPDSALYVLSTAGVHRYAAADLRSIRPGQSGQRIFLPRNPAGTDASLSGIAFLHDRLWISSGYQGIYAMGDDGTGVDFYTSANGLHSETVWDVFADRESNLWFATENGVSRLSRQNLLNIDLSQTNFTQIKSGRPVNDSLFLFTNGIHLYTYNGRSRASVLKGLEENPGFLEERFVLTPDGKIFFTCHSSTRHGNFYYMTRELHVQGGRVVQGNLLRTQTGNRMALDAATARLLGGSLFVCTRDRKLLRYEDGAFRECTVLREGAPVEVVRIAPTTDGGCWVLTGDGRLIRTRYTGHDTLSATEHYPDFLAKSHGVIDLYSDRRGWLWIGTYNDGGWVGVPTGNSTRFIHLLPGTLSSLRVTSFAEDASGRLWIGTMNGLDRLQWVNGRPEIEKDCYGSELCGRYIYFIRPWRDRLAIGTADCMSVIDPERPDTGPDPAPPVFLSGISLNGSPWKGKAAGETAVFSPEDNNLTFSFTGLHYRDESRTRYTYRLVGFDDSWSAPTSAFTVTYPRIAPGSYTFEVRAGTTRGSWSQPARLHFRIKQPVYAQWPFLITAFLLVIGAAYAVYRYRVAQILRLERLRQKLSKDLHDDIGATVSSISILAQMAGSEAVAPEKRHNFLDTISEQSRYVTGALSDIVWSINPEADTPGAMFARMRRYASEIFEARDIQYTISLPSDDAPQLRAGMEMRQNILLIFKEAVNNLAKYAAADHAVIRLVVKGLRLEMIISDNGIGFDPSAAGMGNGLANMRKRAASLRGTLKIESAPGAGTTVCLDIPLRQNSRKM